MEGYVFFALSYMSEEESKATAEEKAALVNEWSSGTRGAARGAPLINVVRKAAPWAGLFYAVEETRNWGGVTLSGKHSKGVDIILLKIPFRRMALGVECKNWSTIISTKELKKLKTHIEKCRILGLKPVHIVSRIYQKAQRELESMGSKVIEVGAQFYSRDERKLAAKMREKLHYYYLREDNRPESISLMAEKLRVLSV